MNEKSYVERTTLAEHQNNMRKALDRLYDTVNELINEYHLSQNDVSGILINLLLVEFDSVRRMADRSIKVNSALGDVLRTLGID